PTGYSFNLDGTSIYMTMAAVFVAQASGVHLSFGQQLSLLAILLLTSKGAAAVTGSGFITLAATLSAFPNIPVAGLALLLGVDRFMSEARAITNLIGNAVATMAIALPELPPVMSFVLTKSTGSAAYFALNAASPTERRHVCSWCGSAKSPLFPRDVASANIPANRVVNGTHLPSLA